MTQAAAVHIVSSKSFRSLSVTSCLNSQYLAHFSDPVKQAYIILVFMPL